MSKQRKNKVVLGQDQTHKDCKYTFDVQQILKHINKICRISSTAILKKHS